MQKERGPSLMSASHSILTWLPTCTSPHTPATPP